MLEKIQAAAPDAILGLSEAYRSDPNPDKVNLGVGVYQDEEGRTPLLASVFAAERRLLESGRSKSYLPIPGDPVYGRAVRALLFGADSARIDDGRAVSCHTPGGTGALRVGADFLKKFYPDATVWLSAPTWANHKGIFPSAGFALADYPYYDSATRGLDFEGMRSTLEQVPAGDIVLLHACCHNPSGVDLDQEQWRAVAAIARAKAWIPFLDFAYQGFGSGLDADAAGLRIMSECEVEFLAASSFSKNFGLYCERTGALTLSLSDTAKAAAAFSHIKLAARTNYSNPPAHGALIVATILEDPGLRAEWERELGDMRQRLAAMRRLFVDKMAARCPGRDFSFITRQYGMFSFSGLSPAQVEWLRRERSIYMVANGRINTAGLNAGNIDYVCDAVKTVLELE